HWVVTARGVHLTREAVKSVAGHLVGGLDNGGVVATSVLVHPTDAGSGKDVVELLDEQRLPCGFETIPRIGGLERVGDRCPEFCVAERQLAVPIVALHVGVRGVGAAVQLEVELAGPNRPVAALGGGYLKELLGSLELESRQSLKAAKSTERLKHLGGRSPTTIAMAERIQRTRRDLMVLETADPIDELCGGCIPGVGVGRREMREDSRAVNTLPEEAVMGHLVVLVPRQLL